MFKEITFGDSFINCHVAKRQVELLVILLIFHSYLPWSAEGEKKLLENLSYAKHN